MSPDDAPVRAQDPLQIGTEPITTGTNISLQPPGASAEYAAAIADVRGNCTIHRADGRVEKAAAGSELYEDDVFEAGGRDAAATIVWRDGTVMSVADVSRTRWFTPTNRIKVGTKAPPPASLWERFVLAGAWLVKPQWKTDRNEFSGVDAVLVIDRLNADDYGPEPRHFEIRGKTAGGAAPDAAATAARDMDVDPPIEFLVELSENRKRAAVSVYRGIVRISAVDGSAAPITVEAGQEVTFSAEASDPVVPLGTSAGGAGAAATGAAAAGTARQARRAPARPGRASRVGPGAAGGAVIGSGPRLPVESAPGAAPAAPARLNTLVHHQVTLDDAIAGGVFPVISGSGNRIVYSHGARPSQIYTIDFDGSNRRQVMETKDIPTELDISDDGSRVMVHHVSREIYAANAAGGGEVKLAWTYDPEIVKARMTGNGALVFFLLGRDANLNDSSEVSLAGLHVMSSGGGAPRHLVGQKELQALLGLPPNEGVAFRPSLEVSADGSRVVFGVVAYSSVNAGPKILVVNGDGSGLRVVAAGTEDSRGGVGQVAITPDGRLVSYRIASWGPPQVTGIVNADGSGNRIITKSDGPLRYPDGNIIGEPVTFTADGAWLQLGSTGLLIATDGSDRMYSLTATRTGAGKVLLNGGMLRGTMSHTAQRYAYLCQDERNSQEFRQRVQIATLEVNPPGLGGAPEIGAVTIEPPYIIPDKQSATIKAAVTSGHPLVLVSKVPMRNGLADPTVSSEILYDDGRTSGDETAGDGVFTSNRLFAQSNAEMGPRIIRVDAESRAEDARRHATAVDTAPIPVSSEPPPAPTTTVEPATTTTTGPGAPGPTTPATTTATTTPGAAVPGGQPPVTATPGATTTPAATTAATGMRIESEHRRVSEGELVTVPVWLKDADDVANINFEVLYDPEVAQPEGDIVKGNLLDDAIFSVNPRELGRMRMGFAQTSGLSGRAPWRSCRCAPRASRAIARRCASR